MVFNTMNISIIRTKIVQHQYGSSAGECRGGNSPENVAGQKVYEDRDCRDRCNMDSGCTGYVLPENGDNWCETYSSIGATGNGDSKYACYMKQGNVVAQVRL